ncbi:phosphotransferase [Variovorax sp. YR752]|uniref:phosphotransferase enzyme family protein n=1 Tax=Variovorax sp. YR752 TaxID=1884383 RepID=UPI00313782F8
MTDTVRQALALWGFDDAECSFVAGRENRVYRVRTGEGRFALRLRRPGYRSEAELLSEALWLEAMDRAALQVPRPRRSLGGALLEKVGAHHVDMVGWLSGQPLGRSGDRLQVADAPAVFRRLGREMARLHAACDVWQRPAGFARCAWNAEGLLGEAPLWGRFWDNPTLDAETRSLFTRFRREARLDLEACAATLDHGLIHADLVRENVLVDGSLIRMLDFDDGGFGFRLFDLATVLLKNLAEPHYADLEAALRQGYASLRPLDDRKLGLFMALRAVTYVGWIVPRMDEDGSCARNERFIAHARQLCADYLGHPPPMAFESEHPLKGSHAPEL